MIVVNGHFDGRQIILDEPVPEGLRANAMVKVIFEGDQPASSLAEIARLAKPGGLPSDFAAQHEHYVKGTPKR